MVTRAPRLLLLTSYFAPDLSAGSFRATALVAALKRLAPDLRVDVITTMPNRYQSFTSDALVDERDGPRTIHRVRLPAHASGMRDQAKAYLRYARAVFSRTRGEPYDLVFATSGRLMTAVLAAVCARRARAALYLDLRDIFVDTIGDVLPGPAQRPAKLVFSPLESFAVRSATHVNLVSEGFRSYFEPRFPRQRFSYFTNGIDDEFLGRAVLRPPPDPARPLRVLYAGNMGEGQGLHAVIPQLASALPNRLHFRLIGDGGRRTELEAAIARAGVRNVEVLSPVPRAELVQEYEAADVLFLHLNAYAAFERVLPSKIFEYAALGKPIWAGVGGYAARFLREEVPNAAVFDPCDVPGGLRALGALALGSAPREEFVARFNRERIMTEMARDLLRLLDGRTPDGARR